MKEKKRSFYTRADVNKSKNSGTNGAKTQDDIVSALIVLGLGGKENISDVDCCATRLRVTVFDYQLVDKDKLKQSGASGIVQKGDGVQVIYGPKVTVIKSNLEDYLESPESDNPIIDEDSNNIGINVDDTNTNISDVNRDNTNVRDMDSKIYQKNNLSAEVYLPINGKVIPLEEIEDGVFSEKCLVKVLLLNHQRVRFMHHLMGLLKWFMIPNMHWAYCQIVEWSCLFM